MRSSGSRRRTSQHHRSDRLSRTVDEHRGIDGAVCGEGRRQNGEGGEGDDARERPVESRFHGVGDSSSAAARTQKGFDVAGILAHVVVLAVVQGEQLYWI